MKIPFNIPTLIGNEIANVTKAIQSNMHCGNGAFSEECINYMKKIYNFHEVFLTTSCSTAMEMGVLLCDIKPGDEVILPSYTFSSTANSFILRGGVPGFCEIDSLNFGQYNCGATPSVVNSSLFLIYNSF